MKEECCEGGAMSFCSRGGGEGAAHAVLSRGCHP